MALRSQVHVEYLIMMGIGVLLALIAATGVFAMADAMSNEIRRALTVKDIILEGLR